MLTRAVRRAARCGHFAAPAASLSARPLPLPLLLSRWLASPSAPPPSNDDDAGAPFVQDGQQEEVAHSQSQSQWQSASHAESLSAASGSFTRQQPSGLNILPPRARGPASSSAPRSRADDPASANLLRQMQQMAVQSHTDQSVPIGTAGQGASSRPRPQKGGRPIQPASVYELHGQLTPLQLHRVLSSTKAEAEAATAAAAAGGSGPSSAYWTDERVARAYSIDTAAVANIRKHLSLPFVMSRDGGMLWHGTVEVPVSVQLQRSLGQTAEPLQFLGQHLAIEKAKGDGEQGKGR